MSKRDLSGRASVLVLEATGYRRRTVWRDTVLHGFFGLCGPGDVLPGGFPERNPDHPLTRFAGWLFRREYDALSYVVDWREALERSPLTECTVVNVHNLPQFSAALKRIARYDLIVVLHSATGDSMDALNRAAPRLAARKGKLAVFIGNEYCLMGRKQDFLRESRADYVLSQLPQEGAEWLYEEAALSAGTRALSVPHGLNPNLYRPGPLDSRPVDVGFVGAFYHLVVGDKERTNAIEWFQFNGAAKGLACDIRQGNIPRDRWSAFLRSCKAIVGAESNTYYLQRRGEAVNKALAYLETHPSPSFKEVFDHAFADARGCIDGKIISSRHFEPIGTKTAQVLVEGRYNGILLPDEHYIPLAKDLSNVDEAVEKLKDGSLRRRMVERTYEYVMDAHTYDHRIHDMLKTVLSDS
ncbi:MAG: glycosyltransferase family protein [Thermodesulfobacteriota bacterium]